MKTFYSEAHLAHAPPEEFEGGKLAPAVEKPERALRVHRRVIERRVGPVLPPSAFGDDAIARVHDRELVTFLGQAHGKWQKKYGLDAAAAIPSAWPARGMKAQRSGDIESALGSYAFDTATPIVRGTWPAARAAVDVVLSGADAIAKGERSAFALTRPPGHHASRDVFGGYCYLNNVAIAAQWFSDQGMRAAILDVDYHHGNGTQAIFYDRADICFVSIHADPTFAYPHFLGFPDENGAGAGENANLNLPLPAGTDWGRYKDALMHALGRIAAHSPDVLLISLGLDTFEDDPIAQFRLKEEDYLRLGECIACAGLPSLFVFEGGYNIDALGTITVNVLEGYIGG
jgi:acetoin utilization deacetylase AcuC-like enzyme